MVSVAIPAAAVVAETVVLAALSWLLLWLQWWL
jgi:hypothetical protein